MDFYRISEEYVEYLKEYETKLRGFTRVPNIKYAQRNKFIFGAVMKIKAINYYVALSSYKKAGRDIIQIRVKDERNEVKGSLRFNYMIPVPDNCIKRLKIKEIEDEKYRRLVYKEWRFCRENEKSISDKAREVYNAVVLGRDESLKKNSCDFIVLEKGYREYLMKRGEDK